MSLQRTTAITFLGCSKSISFCAKIGRKGKLIGPNTQLKKKSSSFGFGFFDDCGPPFGDVDRHIVGSTPRLIRWLDD